MPLKNNSLLNALSKKTIIAVACTGLLYPISTTAAKQLFPKFKEVKLYQDQEEKIYPVKKLDIKPQYVGGEQKFYEYLNTNLIIPEIDKDVKIITEVSFVIEKDGTMSSFKIEKGGEYGVGEEAIRVLKEMPSEWIPGQKNGKAVRSLFKLPITLRVKKS